MGDNGLTPERYGSCGVSAQNPVPFSPCSLEYYNICNNREQLLEALRGAVQRRRQRRSPQPQ